MLLVLDIETVVDGTVWTPPADDPGAFPPPPACAIVCVGALGMLGMSDNYEPQKLACVGGSGEEAAILSAFANIAAKRPRIITWNGRAFDLPVIEARAMRYGIALPSMLAPDVRDRYRGHRHVDVCEMATNYGAARRSSLDAFARLIGLPGKDGTDGSMVADMVAAGRVEDVRNYCLRDVVQTAFLFLRWLLLAGTFTRDTYARAAGDLLAFLEADGRLADLVARIDRKRLLLDDGAATVAA